MSDNLRHWSILSKTDPKHTKAFQRAGGFKGTAIKPIYTIEKMTEHFGPCGVGWGTDEPQFTTITGADETLVYCTVALWYIDAAKRATVYGIGGDKIVMKGKDGPRTSDEAFKAAFTDAVSNAMKFVGMSADVHMGLFDDHKYVREMQREFADEPPPPSPPPQRQPAPAPRPVTPAPKPSGNPLKYELLNAKQELVQAYATPDEWCRALRRALTAEGVQVTAIWESNKGVLQSISDHHPAMRWTIGGTMVHPADDLRKVFEQLAPGVAA